MVSVTPTIDYYTAVSYATGANPWGMVSDDLNQDGHKDLVVVNNGGGSGTSISILQGTGSGSFDAQVVFSGANDPYVPAIGDLNGDGWKDVVHSDQGDNTIKILLNKLTTAGATITSSAFQSPTTSPFGSISTNIPYGLVIADVNGDNKNDIIVANAAGSGSISVYLNQDNSGNNFVADSGSPYTVGSIPATVIVQDFNADGFLDIITDNSYTGTDSISVLLHNGHNTQPLYPSSSAPTYAVGARPIWLDYGDINNDGHWDVCTANTNSASVSLLTGHGNGVFDSAGTNSNADVSVGSSPCFLRVIDVDGNGADDIVVSNSGSNTVTVLLNNKQSGVISFTTFTFSVDSVTATHPAPLGLVVEDFNGDGHQDIATADSNSNAVSVLLQHNTSVCAFPSLPSNSIGSNCTVASHLPTVYCVFH